MKTTMQRIVSHTASLAQRRTRQLAFEKHQAVTAVSGQRCKPTVSTPDTKFAAHQPLATLQNPKATTLGQRYKPTVSTTDPKFSAHQTLVQQAFELPFVRSEIGLNTLSTIQGTPSIGHDLRQYEFEESERTQLLGLRTPNLNQGNPDIWKAEVKEYFNNTFTLFEKLHEIFVCPAAFFIKHERLRHPPIFYVGHTASFYINKLNLGKFMDKRVDSELEMQTAVGVDEMSWDDWDSNSYAWPSGDEAEADPEHARDFLQRCFTLRGETRKLVNEIIDQQPAPEFPITSDSFWWILLMGIEHERIHLETSSCILQQARPDLIQSHPLWSVCQDGKFSLSKDAAKLAPQNSLVEIPEGTTRLGRKWEGTSTWGWDNEFCDPEIQEKVSAFKASKFLVSNAEYLEFVEAGGYKEERFWCKNGRNWTGDTGSTQPKWWVVTETPAGDKEYRLRCLADTITMPWDWPVEVNNLEASAFCAWKSEQLGEKLRLPTDAEFNRVRDREPTDLQASAHGPRWEKAPGNVNLEHDCSPCPVDRHLTPDGSMADVLGNVWQHSVTPMDVWPGFKTHPLYDDFTTPTIDGEHTRIMGGSWISSGANGGTRDSRYSFRPHFFQHAGFRYYAGEEPKIKPIEPYEMDAAKAKQLAFHFEGDEHNYFARLARSTEKWCSDRDKMRVFEFQCGPGRFALELASGSLAPESIHSTDFTAANFAATEQRFIKAGRVRYAPIIEGELCEYREKTIASLVESSDRIKFFQVVDPAHVDTARFSSYDLVVAAAPGFWDRVLEPEKLLSGGVASLLTDNGLFVLGNAWVSDEAKNKAFELLKASGMEPVGMEEDLEYTIQDTLRKATVGLSHVSLWRKSGSSPAPAAVDQETKVGEEDMHVVADKLGQNLYADPKVLAQYAAFHFTPGDADNYPLRCAQRCTEAMNQLGIHKGRAVEFGAGPGRAAMELAKDFESVVGSDYSEHLIDIGKEMLQKDKIQWTSGSNQVEARPSDFGVGDAEKGRLELIQLDACAPTLPADEASCDLVCGFNLIDRLPDPKAFLDEAGRRLRPGGLMVISSPYTWLESFTPKEKWLGGFKYGDNDAPRTIEGLREYLTRGKNAQFEEALAPEDLPFVLQETQRLRQETKAEMSFWRKKN
jgi:5-histidylcysteine sulfoxide synthase/putative 4-mercaptohistidine N1-methyltranferase